MDLGVSPKRSAERSVESEATNNPQTPPMLAPEKVFKELHILSSLRCDFITVHPYMKDPKGLTTVGKVHDVLRKIKYHSVFIVREFTQRDSPHFHVLLFTDPTGPGRDLTLKLSKIKHAKVWSQKIVSNVARPDRMSREDIIEIVPMHEWETAYGLGEPYFTAFRNYATLRASQKAGFEYGAFVAPYYEQVRNIIKYMLKCNPTTEWIDHVIRFNK